MRRWANAKAVMVALRHLISAFAQNHHAIKSQPYSPATCETPLPTKPVDVVQFRVTIERLCFNGKFTKCAI